MNTQVLLPTINPEFLNWWDKRTTKQKDKLVKKYYPNFTTNIVEMRTEKIYNIWIKANNVTL